MSTSSEPSAPLQETIPPYYSDPLKEHQAVRNGVGLFNFNSYGKIEIKGNDRVKFLQGLTTNDLKGLSEGKGQLTVLPTVKGKIASIALVFNYPEYLLLIVHPELREKTIQILNRYKIGTDARIEDVTEKMGLLSIQGPKTENVLKDLIQDELPVLPAYHYFSTKIRNVPVQLIHHGWSGESGVDLLVSSREFTTIWEELLKKGTPHGITPVGVNAYETLRIEAGLPRYGQELSEEILPQEAGLEAKAISYTKGCYIGQETIARLHYLGHTNRSLVGLYVNHPDLPQKDDRIISGEKILGAVTSAVFSPWLQKTVAMAYIQRQFIQPGTPVEIDHQDKKLSAVVTELPFYKTDKKNKNN
ncbi:MAG: CAF17-like 4Fe-4S cluster assembly/insertion protein YgfZ [Nitrospiria bacterium]